MSTTIYLKTAGDLIRDALRDSNIVGAEMPIEVIDFEKGVTALNDVLMLWQSTGINIWRETEAILPLNPGQAKYVFGVDHCFTDGVYTTADSFLSGATTFTVSSTAGMSPGQAIGFELASGERWWDVIDTVDDGVTVSTVNGAPSAGGGDVYAYTDMIDQPVRILDARAANGYLLDEVPIEQISRKEYYDQPSKLSRGIASSWYFSRQLNFGELLLWPVAPNCRHVVRFSFVKPMTIPTDQSNNIQIPPEWFVALKWAVALQLAVGYAIDPQRIATIAALAEKHKEEALSIDVEMDSFSIQPG